MRSTALDCIVAALVIGGALTACGDGGVAVEATSMGTSTEVSTTGSPTTSSSTSSSTTSTSETTLDTSSTSSTTGTTGTTDTTAAPGECGDGVVDVGEACDDGDRDDGDGCTNACVAAVCGDGSVYAGVEVCDDGNLRAGDGCSEVCAPEGLPLVYLTSALSDFGFHGYFAAADAWVTLPSPPNITYTQLTNDGARVYLLGIDNTIYTYTPETQQWDVSPIAGPGPALAGAPTGFFKWTDQGFYYVQDGPTTLYHHKDGAWISIGLPNVGSCAGTWVRAKNELYIRSHQQTGFMVVRTLDDAVIRSITDIVQVPEPSRMGVVSGPFYYVRGMFGPLERLDTISGMKTSTGQFPLSAHTAGDTDPSTGAIYLAGYQGQATTFQRYDPGANVLVTLADSPAVPDLSTITVMIPP